MTRKPLQFGLAYALGTDLPCAVEDNTLHKLAWGWGSTRIELRLFDFHKQRKAGLSVEDYRRLAALLRTRGTTWQRHPNNILVQLSTCTQYIESFCQGVGADPAHYSNCSYIGKALDAQ